MPGAPQQQGLSKSNVSYWSTCKNDEKEEAVRAMSSMKCERHCLGHFKRNNGSHGEQLTSASGVV